VKRSADDPEFRTLEQQLAGAGFLDQLTRASVPAETRRAAQPSSDEIRESRAAILVLFQQHGSMTSDECTARFRVTHPGKDWTGVRPRISELIHEDKALAPTGERRPSDRGKSAAVWDVASRVEKRVA
jgi:predicted HTH transcriptional regulator